MYETCTVCINLYACIYISEILSHTHVRYELHRPPLSEVLVRSVGGVSIRSFPQVQVHGGQQVSQSLAMTIRQECTIYNRGGGDRNYISIPKETTSQCIISLYCVLHKINDY